MRRASSSREYFGFFLKKKEAAEEAAQSPITREVEIPQILSQSRFPNVAGGF